MDAEKRVTVKVLHVIDSEGVYGAEKVVLTLMEEQRKHGIHPVLASIGGCGVEEKQIEQEARSRRLPVMPFRMCNGPNPFGARRLLRFAHGQKMDLIHSHGYKPDILLGFIPRKMRKIPVVATLHGWTGTGRLCRMTLYEWLDRKSLRFIDQVTVVSRAMLEKRNVGRDARIRVAVVHNGISCPNGNGRRFEKDDPIATFCREGFAIGAIGRLSEEKGYRYLVEALSCARQSGVDARLVIIGDGPQRQALTATVRKLHLDPWVLLPGYRERASAYMHCFRVFVLPSLTEGLPVTLLEAMQAEVPVIATSVGGIPEVLGEGRAGLMVRPGDPLDLAAALRRLYEDEGFRAELGRRGKGAGVERFSGEEMAQRYHEIYKEVLERHKTPRSAG